MLLTTGALGRARRGLTLIEILVVISIIVILMALTGAALQKTSENAKSNRTSESVYKLQSSLGAEMQRVNERARKADVPHAVLDYSDGNPERARAIYVAMEQRKYFPQTFVEANTPTYITQDAAGYHLWADGSTHGQAVVYAHPPSVTFKELSTSAATGANSTTDESGALLYLIMSKQSVAGGGAMASATDELSNSLRREVQFNGGSRQAFADQFGQSIGFHRWEFSVAISNYPGVAPNTYSGVSEVANYADPKAGNKDPLDPRNLIGGWNSYKKNELQTQLLFGYGYRVQSVYSLGRDGQFGTKDDVHGFRSLQAGNKGY